MLAVFSKGIPLQAMRSGAARGARLDRAPCMMDDARTDQIRPDQEM
jgi:hypothetical protein